MEPVDRPRREVNAAATAAAAAAAAEAAASTMSPVILFSSTRPPMATVASNIKPSGPCHNGHNVIHHNHQYPVLVASQEVRPPAQLMLSSTTAATTPGVIPQYQQQGVGPHQLITATVTVPVSANPLTAMSAPNVTTVGGMALSPFGILPHDINRHQHKKLMYSQPSKTLIDTGGISNVQIPSTSVINSRFYVEPTHDGFQQKHNSNKIKTINGVSDKSLPVVPNAYGPQSYEQRYQPRTVPQQVGYLSVITRTAVTSSNCIAMDDIVANNNYYQTQDVPLQSKTSDNHNSKQYYHFNGTVPASQTHQLDNNMLLTGTPVQRCDPMHIVKNLQSMQTEIDYGVKKITEPRLSITDNSKNFGPAANLLNNKCTIEHQHNNFQHLPKPLVMDSSSSYNSHYFNTRQPPPAHLHLNHNQPQLQQHIPSLTVSYNGNTYLDVQQNTRHHPWSSDQQKPLAVSTSSCFSGNISTGIFNQPSLQQQHNQFNSTASTFNVQPPTSNVHQMSQPSQTAHHNNLIVSSVNPTYYNPITTSPIVTSVTTTSSSLYNNKQHNPNNSTSSNLINTVPHVIVPNIEQELSYLCDNSISTPSVNTVKPFNIAQQPSFIDSYIKFIHGDTTAKTDDTCNEKPKKLLQTILSSTPKHKPYIPLPTPKIVSGEHMSSQNSSCGDVKKTTENDSRYLTLPKVSSIVSIEPDNKRIKTNNDENWSTHDNNQLWTTSPGNKPSSVIKKKVKKNPANSITTVKKPKITQHEQPRRQLSHRLAKDKSQRLFNNVDDELDADDDDELSDTNSDIDPAWIPNSDDNDKSKNLNSFSSRRYDGHKRYPKKQDFSSGHLPSTSTTINNNNNNNNHLDESIAPFKIGSFVTLKSQYLINGPVTPKQLWRVDGKSLLQKFEKCNENNVYKSLSIYTGWNESHYDMYCQVPIQFLTIYNGKNVMPTKSSTEVFVQILTDHENKSAQNDSSNAIEDSTEYNHVSKPKIDSISDHQNILLRSSFDVFVQALTSQALDPKFIQEIYRENDEYFLSNIRAIETVTQTWIQAIHSTMIKNSVTELSAVDNVHTLIKRYPSIDICSIDKICDNNIQLRCVECGFEAFTGKKSSFVEISLSGTEYNSGTFKNINSERIFSKIMPVKKLICCSNNHCADKLTIIHSLEHLKYNIFNECCKRISVENYSNQLTPEKTTVLNRLLADDEWIEKLYNMVCNVWHRAKKFISNWESNSRILS